MIIVTAKAKEKILALGGRLYLSLENGGCAEYKYKFSLEVFPEVAQVFDCEGVTVTIPESEAEKLSRVVIDYESSLIRRGFTISENPYVAEKCRCGISFR